MNNAFYNAASGLLAFGRGMDSLSQNIANVNTTGYKPGRVVFSDLVRTEMAVDSADEPMQGHGVKAGRADLLLRQGGFEQTGHPLDFAVDGEGFFAVENEEGERLYTRAGIFSAGLSGRRAYLVGADGGYVLDGRGRRIELADDPNGGYVLDDLPGRVGVYAFDNPYALARAEGGFYETAESGRARADEDSEIVAGALERSAVDLSDEMTNMMIMQRSFQMSARLVQTADGMEEIVNQLR